MSEPTKIPPPFGRGIQLGEQTLPIMKGNRLVCRDAEQRGNEGNRRVDRLLVLILIAPGFGTQIAENHQSHFLGAVGFIPVVAQNLAREAVAQTDLTSSLVRTQVLADCVVYIIGLDLDFIAIVLNGEIVIEVFHSYQFLSFDELIIARFWLFVKRVFQLFFWAVGG